MVGWHHQLDGYGFAQASVVGSGQGSLVFCSPWGHEESDITERLTELKALYLISRVLGGTLLGPYKT